jgi:hypothetical protein
MFLETIIKIFGGIYNTESIVLSALVGLFVFIYFILHWHFDQKFKSLILLKIGLFISGGLQLILGISYSIIQGLVWNSTDTSVAKALVPPFAPFGYIASYTWMHFLKGTIFTFAGALGLFFLLKLINKLGYDRFFYEEEYWLAALGCLAVGWPNLILYFFIATFLSVIIHIIALALKKEGKISLLYMWPIAMIITIIFGNKLATLTGLIQLKP